jgi:hypothetical protein
MEHLRRDIFNFALLSKLIRYNSYGSDYVLYIRPSVFSIDMHIHSPCMNLIRGHGMFLVNFEMGYSISRAAMKDLI